MSGVLGRVTVRSTAQGHLGGKKGWPHIVSAVGAAFTCYHSERMDDESGDDNRDELTGE